MRQGIAELRLRVMGSACHICVEDIGGRGQDMLSLAKAELQRLETKFSAYYSASIIGKINKNRGSDKFTALDKESRSLFEFANALWQESNHQFDPSSKILHSCYSNGKPVKGSSALLSAQLGHVGWSKVEITENGVRLQDKDMLIDLNSCIRPYAIDSIRRIFLGNDVGSALISLDNDIATIGKQRDGANWLAGVKCPKSSGVAITRLKLNHRGYAVRGDFQKTITIDGERYGTALSPIDGRPIPGLLSVGVITDSCLAACGAASVAQVKTEQAALKWLENLGFPWVAIGRDYKCYGLLDSN